MTSKTAVKRRQRTAGTVKKATRARTGSMKPRSNRARVGVPPPSPPEIPFGVEQNAALAAPTPPAKPAAARVYPSARCCIVAAAFERATTGAVRMRLKRRGQIALVLLVPGPAWIEPVRNLFQLRFTSWEVIAANAWNNTPKQKEAQAVEIATHLARGRPVVGVAAHRDALPSTLTAAADLTIQISAPDAGVISRAIRMYAGEKPVDGIDDGVAPCLDFNDLVAAFRKNSSASDIVDRLRKASAALRGAGSSQRLPALETAVEYGAARDWGLPWRVTSRTFAPASFLGSGRPRRLSVFRARAREEPITLASWPRPAACRLVAFSIADLFTTGPGYLDSVIKSSRAMFERAASMASPCSLLFLDEIDALPNRATMSPRGADWWTPVITDFLLGLDAAVSGQRAGIVVIGATNNLAGVDAALLRPGRLERAIEITRPNHAGILNVLRYHLHKDLIDADITDVGHLLAGSTPADVMMVVRGARRTARYAGRDLVLDDLLKSVSPADDIAPTALWRICVHESAHAIGSLAVPYGILQRCIVGGVAGSGGRTMIKQETDDLPTQDAVERRAVVGLCGRAAEKLLLGEHRARRRG